MEVCGKEGWITNLNYKKKTFQLNQNKEGNKTENKSINKWDKYNTKDMLVKKPQVSQWSL